MIFHRKFMTHNEDMPTDHNQLMVKMVTSYSIFLLIILLLGIYLYSSTNKNVSLQFQEQNKHLLSNAIQSMDKDLDIMEVFCRQLLQDNDIMRLATSTGPETPYFLATGFSMRQDLGQNVYPEILLPINDYFIHFKNSKYLLSSHHFVERSLFYSGTRLFPEELYDTWISYLEDPFFLETLNNLDEFIPVPTQHYYMYTIDLNKLSTRNIEATASFILDSNKMALLFQNINLYRNGFLIIANNEGELLFTMTDEEDPFIPIEIDINQLGNLNYIDDFSSTQINGMHMNVIKQASTNTNWYYYLVQPSSAAFSSFRHYQIIFILSILFSLVLGVWIVLYLSKRNVQPIVKLGQELSEVVETKHQLQQVVDLQKPIICNSYVRQLMLGNISSQNEADYIREYLDIPTKFTYYNILYAVVYNNETTEDNNASAFIPIEEINKVVFDALKKFIYNANYKYLPSERTYAILLACTEKEETSFIMNIQKTVLELHDYLLNNHSIWLFAGIGRNTDSLINIWESYQQAAEAVSYASKNHIFLPYEIIQKDSNVFYYPTELSAKLIHFITSGNQVQVSEIFNLIHQENIEERVLPINILRFLLSDIRNTLLKARFNAPPSTEPSILEALDQKFEDHLSFKLCEDIAFSLCTLFQTHSTDSSLSSAIEKYITTNFHDPSLCLNKISDEFQISESYFSHMFKEKTGVNFSVYLENIRMAEAARLIRETKTNLSDLYLNVGYNNVNTFRRAFKKTFGVTPSSMRDTANTNS